eukprot:6332487-Prymnesium_polylepis.1
MAMSICRRAATASMIGVRAHSSSFVAWASNAAECARLCSCRASGAGLPGMTGPRRLYASWMRRA